MAETKRDMPLEKVRNILPYEETAFVISQKKLVE